MGFRDRLHNLLFKPSKTSTTADGSESESESKSSTSTSKTHLSLEELAGPRVTISTPVSQIKAVSEDKIDFKKIFESAGIGETNPFATAEKVMELRKNFSSLPEATQVESVEATFKTFGISEGQVVADATSKGEAIEFYMQMTQEETTTTVNKINEEIAKLNQQIEAKKKELQERLAHQELINKACEAEMQKYEDILRFLASNDPKV
jgi:hypothetical protein